MSPAEPPPVRPHLTLLHSFALVPSPCPGPGSVPTATAAPLDTFGTRQEERLLAYLALRPGVARSRAGIVATFWPDLETGKARKLLSLYLFKLNERLARSGVLDAIEDTRETLRLSPTIRTDAQAFAELVLAGTVAHSPIERTQHLLAAVELYGDGLLPAYDYPWVTEQRAQMEVLYRHAVTSLAALLDPSGKMQDLLDTMPPAAWKGLARLGGRGVAGSDAGSSDPPDGADGADGADDAEPLDAHALAHFVRDAAATLRGAHHRLAVERLSERIDELHAVLAQRPTVASFPVQLGIAADLWRFWYLARRVPEGRSYLERLLASGLDAPPDIRAAALHAAGTLANLEGDRAVGIPRLQTAAELWHLLGDDQALLRTIVNLALARHDAGAFEAARAIHDQAIRLARRLGEEGSLARALFNGALTELKLGDHRAARALLQEQLALPMAALDPRLRGVSHAHLATAALIEGDREAARAEAEAALEALALAPDPSALAIAWCVMGRVDYLDGRLEMARSALETSVEQARAAKDMGLTGMALGYLALVYERLGQPDMAARCTMNAMMLMRSAGADELVGRFVGGDARVLPADVGEREPAPGRDAQ